MIVESLSEMMLQTALLAQDAATSGTGEAVNTATQTANTDEDVAGRITMAIEIEMKIELPMLRTRWKIAVPSGTKRLSSVAKVMMESGIQQNPTPIPCTKAAISTSLVDTVTSKPLMTQPPQACNANPTNRGTLGSSRDNANMAAKLRNVPAPRADRICPMMLSG